MNMHTPAGAGVPRHFAEACMCIYMCVCMYVCAPRVYIYMNILYIYIIRSLYTHMRICALLAVRVCATAPW